MTNVPEFEREDYPYYEKGMELPNGVYPPLENYTHEALIEEACAIAYEYLIGMKVNTTLAKETVFSMGALINAEFEQQLVEYKIATFYQKPYKNTESRARSIEAMAREFSTLAGRALMDAISGSPILVIGKEACRGLVECVRQNIRDRILDLKDIPTA